MSRCSKFRYFSSVALACLVLMVSGCGDGRPSRVKVSGTVKLDGENVTEGSVAFKPIGGGRMGIGAIGPDGNFTVSMYVEGDGLPPGEYAVSINSSKNINDTTLRWFAPKKYADVKTSGLTAEIKQDTDSMNFELTWEGSGHKKPWNQRQ